MNRLLVLLLLFLGATGLPNDSYQPLFVIERSTNANVIHYDAKLGKDGVLDAKEPVVAYWIMLAGDGGREELTMLERSRAYGFTISRDKSGGSWWMTLVSQKRREIHIYQEGGKVRAVTLLEGTRPIFARFTSRRGNRAFSERQTISNSSATTWSLEKTVRKKWCQRTEAACLAPRCARSICRLHSYSEPPHQNIV